MATYNVHLYREMRLFYPGIAADSAEKAALIATEKQTDEAQRIEDCEGVNIAALVDVQGDTDYEHSVVIDLKPHGGGAVTTQETAEKTARLPDSLPKRTLLEELAEIDAAYAEGATTPEHELRGQEIVALANAAPRLLASLKDLLGDRPCVQGGICQHCGRDYIGDMVEGDCPADDCPSYEARAISARSPEDHLAAGPSTRRVRVWSFRRITVPRLFPGADS